MGHSNRPGAQPRYMNVAETAEYLRLSQKAVRRLVDKRAIPFRRPENLRRIFFRPDELDQWMDSGDRVTPEDLGV